MKIRYYLTIGLFIAIMVIVCVNFLFKETPEFFKGGYQCGQILSNLSLAYIASIIFYLIVNVVKENHDKKNVSPYLYQINKKIINSGSTVFDSLTKSLGKEQYKREGISKEEYKELCTEADPHYIFDIEGAVAINIKGRILENSLKNHILYFAIRDVKNKVSEMFKLTPYLETGLINILNRISISDLVENEISFSDNNLILKGGLADFSDMMYDFLQLINELEQYNDKYLSKYN